jgi:restriction system protein
MTQSSRTGQTLPSPTLAEIGSAVRVLDGEPVQQVRELMNTIFQQAAGGSPSLDWSDPECWIDARLSGELQALARRIWEGSDRTLNPRHLYAQISFIGRLRLLDPVAGIYRIGERGRRFLCGDEAILRELVSLRSSRRRRVPGSSGTSADRDSAPSTPDQQA